MGNPIGGLGGKGGGGTAAPPAPNPTALTGLPKPPVAPPTPTVDPNQAIYQALLGKPLGGGGGYIPNFQRLPAQGGMLNPSSKQGRGAPPPTPMPTMNPNGSFPVGPNSVAQQNYTNQLQHGIRPPPSPIPFNALQGGGKLGGIGGNLSDASSNPMLAGGGGLAWNPSQNRPNPYAPAQQSAFFPAAAQNQMAPRPGVGSAAGPAPNQSGLNQRMF